MKKYLEDRKVLSGAFAQKILMNNFYILENVTLYLI